MPLLPKDLQRFKIDGPNASPQYIKKTASVVQIAEQLLDCFRYCPDASYGDLSESLEPLCLSSQRHRLIRGLIHILESRLTFDEAFDIDPVVLREELFKQAAQIDGKTFLQMGWRDDILKRTAEKFHFSDIQMDEHLYSDLRNERKIQSFEDLEPDELIAEYNLTLAKSLLLYATKLTFTIDIGTEPAQTLRKLFQTLRFFNLLFEAQPITDSFWQFAIDGPSSVLPQPQKYASSLAMFLPTLYLFSAWHATAELELDGKKCTWQLKPDDFEAPPVHLIQRPSEEAEQLEKRIPEVNPLWEITHDTPILQIGPQNVWIPDFSLRNKSTGITAHVEVIGLWRADYLNRRLKNLHNSPGNLILVLSDKLKMDKQKLSDLPIEMVFFKRTPRPQDVIAAAMKCGKC
ncbi:MAG: DUF790 family protein [Proteobacteria bacterium]|nr:DUF790 family protein [Pseudomonadota bacterium]